MRSARSILLLVLPIAAAGCVERTMTVTSSPSGAVVTMNDREIGRTPLTTDFTWYGVYDVRVRAPGYKTLRVEQPVNMPWWQIPPLDLIAEFFPNRPTDRKSFHYELEPVGIPETDPAAMLGRAAELRGQLEPPPTK